MWEAFIFFNIWVEIWDFHNLHLYASFPFDPSFFLILSGAGIIPSHFFYIRKRLNQEDVIFKTSNSKAHKCLLNLAFLPTSASIPSLPWKGELFPVLQVLGLAKMEFL